MEEKVFPAGMSDVQHVPRETSWSHRELGGHGEWWSALRKGGGGGGGGGDKLVCMCLHPLLTQQKLITAQHQLNSATNMCN